MSEENKLFRDGTGEGTQEAARAEMYKMAAADASEVLQAVAESAGGSEYSGDRIGGDIRKEYLSALSQLVQQDGSVTEARVIAGYLRGQYQYRETDKKSARQVFYGFVARRLEEMEKQVNEGSLTEKQAIQNALDYTRALYQATYNQEKDWTKKKE